jgi:hypothetical protein
MIYIYWAKGTDFYKVGYTSRTEAEIRRKEWETGCPYSLAFIGSVDGTRNDESKLHKKLKRQGEWIEKAAGKEWFRLTQDDVEKILGYKRTPTEDNAINIVHEVGIKLIKSQTRKASRRKDLQEFTASILKEFL